MQSFYNAIFGVLYANPVIKGKFYKRIIGNSNALAFVTRHLIG